MLCSKKQTQGRHEDARTPDLKVLRQFLASVRGNMLPLFDFGCPKGIFAADVVLAQAGRISLA